MAHLELNSNRVKSLRLMVPRSGCWLARVSLDNPVDLEPGAASLQVGGVTLTGFLLPEASGRYLVRTRARVVGGAGGWRSSIPARPYHNDAGTGVSAKTVITGAASAAGETLTGDFPPAAFLGADWLRQAGPARRVLDALAPDWWVDFDGLTHLVARPSSVPAAGVELKDFDPISSLAELRMGEISDVAVGAVIPAGKLPRDMTIVGLEYDFRDILVVGAWLQ